MLAAESVGLSTCPMSGFDEKRLKKAVNIPVIVVGGITNLGDIESIINNNKCDMVSMSRPFIIEPDLVNKFKTGKQTQSKCIQCNFCIIGSTSK